MVRKAGAVVAVFTMVFGGINMAANVDRTCMMPEHSLSVMESVCEKLK